MRNLIRDGVDLGEPLPRASAAVGAMGIVIGIRDDSGPTDGFQRLACLPKAKNQKFSADSYRSGAQNSVTTKPFTVSTGHTTSERNSTDRKTKRKKNNQEQLLDWTVV
ncbi:hypothetical protein L3Y34_009383 [Caenorhabditis briggsae]|uniref:Uncharacterized protein n=1 Tax=Caenorhabditis briggsae TaxID=6238 RepID=A0AAE9A573_CAEBR|nr:hypothetical protein L3Y34_009383 [Caenorhabditis briggsae]